MKKKDVLIHIFSIAESADLLLWQVEHDKLVIRYCGQSWFLFWNSPLKLAKYNRLLVEKKANRFVDKICFFFWLKVDFLSDYRLSFDSIKYFLSVPYTCWLELFFSDKCLTIYSFYVWEFLVLYLTWIESVGFSLSITLWVGARTSLFGSKDSYETNECICPQCKYCIIDILKYHKKNMLYLQI